MGEMADIYEDYALRAWDNYYDTQVLIDENAQDGVWVNANGDEVAISSISPDYARNIIYWCEARDLTAPQEIKNIGEDK